MGGIFATKIMEFVIAYITNPTMEEARTIARNLLKKRLIACANIFPISSFYWWEGEITEDNEYVLFAKTGESYFEKVVDEVEKMHSYDVPAIIRIPVSSNSKYFDWLMSEIE